MKKIINYNYLKRQPSLLLSVFVLSLLTAGAIYGVSCLHMLKTTYSMKQFQPHKHPLIESDNHVKNSFFLEEEPALYATIAMAKDAKGTWLQPVRIKELREATTRISEHPNVSSATSIATVEGAFDTKEGLSVGPLLEQSPEATWEKRVLQDPILSPQLISQDGRKVLIVVERPDLDNKDIIQISESLRGDLQARFANAEIAIGGSPAIQAQLSDLLSVELGNLGALALLASIFALILVFRNFSSVIVPLYILALANIAVLSWMAITGTPFTILSTTIPILVSVTVVSMVTHTMLRFTKEWRNALRQEKNPNKADVVLRTIRVLFIPNLLTSLTTCVGFAALANTNVPLISQYGGTTALSVLISWVASMLALPAFLILCPIPTPRNWTQKSAAWAFWVMNNRKTIFYSLVSVCLLMALVGQDLKWTARFFDDLPVEHEARRSTVFVDENMGGMIGYDIVLQAEEHQSWNDPDKIKRLDSLVAKWRLSPNISTAISLPDFIRASSLTKSGKLPSKRAEIAEIYFLYSLSENRPLDKFLTSEGQSARILLRLHDVAANDMAATVALLKKEAVEKFPELKVIAAGMATTAHPLNNELSVSLLKGFWEALGLIAILLLLVFRSLRWTLIAIVPNLVPPVALLYFLAIFETPIKPGIALIFSIALGLAFNNTVYMLGRLRSIFSKNRGNTKMVERALYLEGVPCILSTISLVAGFTVFLASYFQINQLFGTYMLVSILGGLVGDLLLLPTCLAQFGKFLPPPRRYGFSQKAEIINLASERKEKAMSTKVAASFLAFIMLSFPSEASSKQSKMDRRIAAVKALDADTVLKRVEKRMYASNESAKVIMKTYERNGAAKTREMIVKRKSQKKNKKILVRLLNPGDLRGTGLLSMEKSGKKDQWIYLPSSKKTRRILSRNQGGGFMGSELSYEDMGGMIGVEFKNRTLKEEKIKKQNYIVIESIPFKGQSTYKMIHTWVSAKNDVITQAKYYDKKGKLLKIASFFKYKKFGKIYRAQKLQVKNVQNGRSTVMLLQGLEIKKKIDDDEFTVAALEDD